MDVLKVRKRVLCDFLIDNKNSSISDLVSYLQTQYSINPEQSTIVNNNLKSYFLGKFQKKWKECFYNKSGFENKFQTWLESDFVVNFTNDKATGGRKHSTLPFKDVSVGTKRRRLLSIEKDFTDVEIQEAFLRNLRTTGRKKIANAIEELLNSADTEDFNLSNMSDNNSYVPYSPEEAVALSEQARLSKYQYQVIQLQAKERKAEIYPPYYQLLNAKKECYPSEVHVTEGGASIQIQSLINHSINRLFKDPSLSLPHSEKNEKTIYLNMEFKYGIDGLSTETTYNQKFCDANLSDENLLTASMVPVCLRLRDTSNIVWQNPHTASSKRCIPIMLKFAKETKEMTKSEIEHIKSQIQNLKPTTITTVNAVYVVKTDMKLTMVDGKVCQALTDTPSASTCYICRAKPSQMNDLLRVKQMSENINFFDFGLSTLHARIRFMECILHIAYKLQVKKWSVSIAEEKEIVKITKQRICDEFKKKVGLIVDQPRQGSGNSNCGNTSRRFFADVEQSAEITGVDKELIKRFGQILEMLTTNRKIPSQFFNDFTFKTAQLYVKLYPWYYMPSPVHKILLHGGKVMDSFLLPIGVYSEEASEARNKDIKHFRNHNTRKTSRLHTVEDLIHKLLVSSDLYIGSLRPERETIESDLDPEIVQLIDQYESGIN